MLRTLTAALLLCAGLLSAAVAQDAPRYVEGEDYDLISPAIRTSDPSQVEITEFFWYGCGHCYTFEPLVQQWKKSLPEGVVVKGSPAIWNPLMELHARAFYAAEVLGVLDRMHLVLFQAMNVDRKRLASEQEIARLFAANGVDAEAFSKAFNSFGVSSMARQANSRARAAQISGTPEIMVNGKYRVSTRKAGSQANMLKVAEWLAEQERAALQVAGASE